MHMAEKKVTEKKEVVAKKVDTSEGRYIVRTKVIDTLKGTTTFKQERVAKV